MIFRYCILFLFVLPGIVTYSQDAEDSITWSIDLEDVVVTAQFAPTDSRNAVHRIRSIQREEIAARGVTNLEQLLQHELNIRISQDLILGSSLNLQGLSGQNIQVMVDGIPVIGRLGDDIDLGQINLNNIERVEIVEGPLSVNYGTNALGGVVNLISKGSQIHRFETQVETKWESTKRFNGYASMGYRPFSNLLIRLHGGGLKFNGFNTEPEDQNDEIRAYQWNPKKQYNAGVMARVDFKNDNRIIANASWFDEEITNLGEIRRPQFKPYSFDDYYNTRRLDYSIHHEGALGANLYVNSKIGFNTFRRFKNSYRMEMETGEQSLLADQQDTSEFHALLFRPTVAYHIPESKFSLMFGLDLNYEDATGVRIQDETTSKPNFSELGNYAAFGSLKYEMSDAMIVQIGARAAYNTKFNAPLVPSINFKFEPFDQFSVRASYAKGFRSPSLKELFFYFVDANHFIVGNDDLKAETSDNIQITFLYKNSIKTHQWEASLTGFYNNITNKIDLFQFTNVDGNMVPAGSGSASTQYAYFNRSKFKSIGADLRLGYTFNNLTIKTGFSPIGRYNLLYETTKEVSPYNFVYEMNGNIQYRLQKDDLVFSFYFRYLDKLIQYFSDEDELGNAIIGESIQDGYTLSDFTISKYVWNRRIRLVGGVQNLLDITNIPITGSSGGVHSSGLSIPVGMGRAYFVTLNWHLGFD